MRNQEPDQFDTGALEDYLYDEKATKDLWEQTPAEAVRGKIEELNQSMQKWANEILARDK